jgi:AcrR family transcriptional regulator
MTRYPEKRRAALEATMQAEVLRVAGAILREEGIEALTMDRIAREIGVSRGTLYNYFADADAVLNFVEARTFDPVIQRVEQVATSSATAPKKLEGVAHVVLDALYEDRALVMALFAKKELHGPRAEQKRRHREYFVEVVSAIVGQGMAEGSLRTMEPALGANLFLGATSGLIDSMIYAGELEPADALVPGLMDVMLRGMSSSGDAAARAEDHKDHEDQQ